jgi:YVTN family beta-propeller protein
VNRTRHGPAVQTVLLAAVLLPALVTAGPVGARGVRAQAAESARRVSGARGAAAAFAQTFIPVSGAPLWDVVIDPTSTYAFATNRTLNRVEVLNLATLQLESPVPVGSKPVGLDVTPDGSTIYVANSGEPDVSVVDVPTRVEVRRIPTPPGSFGATPFWLAIPDNGLALLRQHDEGGNIAGLYQIDLATDEVTERRDQNAGGNYLFDSPDRRYVGLVGGSSGGPVDLYCARSDTFCRGVGLQTFVDSMALDEHANRIVVGQISPDWDTYELNRRLWLRGTIPGTPQQPGWTVGISPDGRTGYRVSGENLETFSIRRFAVTGSVPLADSVDYNPHPVMAISPDGTMLVLLTWHGIVVMSL